MMVRKTKVMAITASTNAVQLRTGLCQPTRRDSSGEGGLWERSPGRVDSRGPPISGGAISSRVTESEKTRVERSLGGAAAGTRAGVAVAAVAGSAAVVGGASGT